MTVEKNDRSILWISTHIGCRDDYPEYIRMLLYHSNVPVTSYLLSATVLTIVIVKIAWYFSSDMIVSISSSC